MKSNDPHYMQFDNCYFPYNEFKDGKYRCALCGTEYGLKEGADLSDGIKVEIGFDYIIKMLPGGKRQIEISDKKYPILEKGLRDINMEKEDE